MMYHISTRLDLPTFCKGEIRIQFGSRFAIRFGGYRRSGVSACWPAELIHIV